MSVSSQIDYWYSTVPVYISINVNYLAHNFNPDTLLKDRVCFNGRRLGFSPINSP